MPKTKKLLSALVSVVLLLTMFAIPVSAEENYDKVITIVHTNDVHSRADGEAYVSSLVKSLKSDGENVLLMSAGDVLHGQPLATISKGKSIVDIMNATGYDFMAPGNHDFNYGIDRLLELQKSMKFALLAANVTESGVDSEKFTNYSVVDVDGVKVGVFGLATPETATKTNPKNVAGYEFASPVETAKKAVSDLKEEGAEVIIALVHLGLDEESAPEERSEAIAAVEGIDVVIDGHSHTALENGKTVGNTLIAQTGEYLNNIGVVKIGIKDNKVANKEASFIEVPTEENPSEELLPDKTITDLIDKLNSENELITSEVIGKTPVKLEGERADARTKETNLSNLLTEAMIAATDADIAITNGGGIRASIEAGDITKGDVLAVLPFGNFIATIDVTGKDIWDALEHGLDSYPEPAGHFSQVGGVTVVYNSTKPAGERVVSVTFDDGSTLDLNKTYTLATNDFMVAGGDNYSMFSAKAGENYMEYGALDEALTDYIASGVDIGNIKMGRLVDDQAAATPAPAEEPTPTPTPEPAPTPTPVEKEDTIEAGDKVYVVVPGDCLINIANKYDGVTWRQIADLNGLKDPYIIYPDQVILIP